MGGRSHMFCRVSLLKTNEGHVFLKKQKLFAPLLLFYVYHIFQIFEHWPKCAHIGAAVSP